MEKLYKKIESLTKQQQQINSLIEESRISMKINRQISVKKRLTLLALFKNFPDGEYKSTRSEAVKGDEVIAGSDTKCP